MKIFIVCSKQFYPQVNEIKLFLEGQGHEIILPNCYDDPSTEERMMNLGYEAHQKFKSEMFERSVNVIKDADAILVLNYDKEKNGVLLKNYIGGATFLEMYDAFRLNKRIFMMNDIPEGILFDEIQGFDPIIISGNLDLVKSDNLRIKH